MKDAQKNVVSKLANLVCEATDLFNYVLRNDWDEDPEEELTQPGDDALDEEETQVVEDQNAHRQTTKKLDPPYRVCPFCDSKIDAWVVTEIRVEGMEEQQVWYVRCGWCNAMGPDKETESDAIWAWNGFME